MHPQRALALCINEDVDRVDWVYMHWTAGGLSVFERGWVVEDKHLMIHLGTYAPIGINPKSKGPQCSPISLNAGHTGRWSYSGPWSSLPIDSWGTAR